MFVQFRSNGIFCFNSHNTILVQSFNDPIKESALLSMLFGSGAKMSCLLLFWSQEGAT